jgi:hypothetical protein
MFFRAWAFSSGDIFFASLISSSKNCCLVTQCGSGFLSFKGTSHTVNYMLNSATSEGVGLTETILNLSIGRA